MKSLCVGFRRLLCAVGEGGLDPSNAICQEIRQRAFTPRLLTSLAPPNLRLLALVHAGSGRCCIKRIGLASSSMRRVLLSELGEIALAVS